MIKLTLPKELELFPTISDITSDTDSFVECIG